MKGVLTAALAATALAVAACSEQNGAGRPLGLTAAGDSSGDSIPGRKPGPVASVTVSPPSASVAVGDSTGFFADLRDAQGSAITDDHVKWSVADPTVARIEGEFGQSVILRALQPGATTVTARSHGKSGTAQLVVTDSLPPPPPDSTPPPPDSTPPPPPDSTPPPPDSTPPPPDSTPPPVGLLFVPGRIIVP